MANEYDKTFKFGKSTVHIVAPPEKTDEEIEEILKDYHKAGWAIIEEMIERGEKV